jgi:hypothetical protein
VASHISCVQLTLKTDSLLIVTKEKSEVLVPIGN